MGGSWYLLIYKRILPCNAGNRNQARKTLEARNKKYTAGIYWLGFRGVIHGVAKLGPGTLVESDKDWERLREEHLIQTPSPPYAKTYLFEILACERRNIPFMHLKGAVNTVRYRGK